VTRENIARNGVQQIISLARALLCPVAAFASPDAPVETFNALGVWDGTFDLLLMNILADVIAKSARAIAACLTVGGWFIVSGIIQTQEDKVHRELVAGGLTVAKRRVKKDWVALIGRKEQGQGTPMRVRHLVRPSAKRPL